MKPLITSGKWHDANTSENVRCGGEPMGGDGRIGIFGAIYTLEDERLEPTNHPFGKGT